jgi:hypothetical protein
VAPSRRPIRIEQVGLWIPAALGAVFFLVGAVVAARTASFVARSREVTATVVDWEMRADQQDGSKSRTMWYPILEFSDRRGDRHTFRGGLARSEGWRRGDPVAVRYDERNPADARMAGGLTWLLPVVFMVLGGGVCRLALLAERGDRTERRPGLAG